MPSLKLEDHAFRLLENEQTARAFLNRTAHTWEWELDLPGGEVLFREPGTGRILFSSPVKLIGTYDQHSGAFRFGWADPNIPEDWKCVTGLGRMRVIARGAGLEVFDSSEPTLLSTPTKAQSWSIACAGYLKAFFVFEARQDGQTQFLTVESFPDAGLIERDIHIAAHVIDEGKLRFSMNHKEAIIAYLGSPTGAGGSNLADETFFWEIGDSQLRVQFAHHGQIMNMNVSTPEPPAAIVPDMDTAPERKPGLLTRLFGKRNG
jgi:hypothetical protein